MHTVFLPLTLLTAAMFAIAPWLIVGAPYESSMGLVQKIFYFHFSAWMGMFAATAVCGIASARVLFARRKDADIAVVAAAELVVVFGLIGLITGTVGAGEGLGRRGRGMRGNIDAGALADLRVNPAASAFRWARLGALVGGGRAVRAVQRPICVLVGQSRRTLHPKTSVVPTLPVSMGVPLWFSTVAFLGLFTLLFAMRTRLERRRAELNSLHLALDD